MSKAIPKVQKYMTTLPHTIGVSQPLIAAYRLMKEERIRHLPVLDGGQLVGLLSDRDIHFIESLRDVDPQKVRVEDAMTASPYTVSPDSPLDEVVGEMAAKRYGSAIVTSGERVVGIFTAVDAMQAFHDLLQSRLS